jgi:multicomponent Na+:H+ antiporter subunit B
MAAVGATGIALLLGWGLFGLPDFGGPLNRYATTINAVALPERHATNAVGAVVFDYRGFDTLAEEFILFTSVIGVTMLLRAQRDETEGQVVGLEDHYQLAGASAALRLFGLFLVAPILVAALSLVVHGHVTPGGGFQGGAFAATAPLLVFLVGETLLFRRVHPVTLLDVGEGLGAAGFVVIGLLGLVSAAAYLTNVWPLGTPGSVFSAGTMPVISVAIGLEVAAGLVFLVFEFVEQVLIVRRS